MLQKICVDLFSENVKNLCSAVIGRQYDDCTNLLLSITKPGGAADCENKTSAPIGALEVKLSALLSYGRPTNQPTERPVHGELPNPSKNKDVIDEIFLLKDR